MSCSDGSGKHSGSLVATAGVRRLVSHLHRLSMQCLHPRVHLRPWGPGWRVESWPAQLTRPWCSHPVQPEGSWRTCWWGDLDLPGEQPGGFFLRVSCSEKRVLTVPGSILGHPNSPRCATKKSWVQGNCQGCCGCSSGRSHPGLDCVSTVS